MLIYYSGEMFNPSNMIASIEATFDTNLVTTVEYGVHHYLESTLFECIIFINNVWE